MDLKEFKKRLSELYWIILNGNLYFKAWVTLYNKDEETAKALYRYHGFFLLVQDALKDMALLQFSKAFDNDPQTSSFRTLLKAAMKNRQELTPYATEKDLNNFDSMVNNNNEDLLKRLKGLRNQRLTHWDHKYNKKEIRFGEITKLANDMLSMHNSLSKWHDGTVATSNKIIEKVEKHTIKVVNLIKSSK
jgi:hypothetical protein